MQAVILLKRLNTGQPIKQKEGNKKHQAEREQRNYLRN